MTTTHLQTPRLSVVIPAHNEAHSLASCLASIADSPLADTTEVVVVPNGCTDDTADVARRFAGRLPHLTVAETPVPSKVHALNVGDRHATAFPRVYLDADIALSPDALPALREALSGPQALVATPQVIFDTSAASQRVKRFYRIFERLPYARDGLVGLGVYALSAAGRARFDAFPDLTSDDLFVQRLFAPHERRATAGTFVVRTPRRWKALVKVRARIARGNREFSHADLIGVDHTSSSRSTALALVRLVARDPRLAPAAGTYLMTWVAARQRARSGARWERDESTRVPPSTRVTIEGVAFDKLTEEGVVRHVVASFAEGRGGVIVTPNVDIMSRLREQGVEHLVRDADLVVADGMPLVWASHLAGDALPERVAGSDLVWSLSRAAARYHRSVYFLGAAEGVGAEAARRITDRHPGLRVAGISSPPLGFEKDPGALEKVLAAVVDARPDIVFVALGFPKQERVSRLLHDRLPGSWFLGCGGALDMAAGRVARARPLLQRVGAEWLHRLVQEPARMFQRYIVRDLPYALGMLARSAAARGVHAPVQERDKDVVSR